jgi:hypothetical protein
VGSRYEYVTVRLKDDSEQDNDRQARSSSVVYLLCGITSQHEGSLKNQCFSLTPWWRITTGFIVMINKKRRTLRIEQGVIAVAYATPVRLPLSRLINQDTQLLINLLLVTSGYGCG